MRFLSRGKKDDEQPKPSTALWGPNAASPQPGPPPPPPTQPVAAEQSGWGSSAGEIAKRVAAAAGTAAIGAANVTIHGPEWEPGQVVRQRGDKVEVNVSSPAEAKLAIKELRLIKKEWQARKKELAAVKAEENARWRER